ncbi:MAG: single-stranded-DNA-specific exonuclease RecJ [Candidatus Pacebacteria bacterium]|nr:single-stranded-DNA-specific exonuclease RecJ [Candidatus Paceibacterota bacterium]
MQTSDIEITDVVRSLLKSRGVETPEDIEAFLRPDYEAHTHRPELIADMSLATERLLDAIAQNQRIAVYADFDCDGIPGASVLSDFFEKIGHENVRIYIPHRDREGYGFHRDAITTLAKDGVQLIVTVDVGTNAYDAVRHANTLGVDVIVTDHHELIGDPPPAVAVLNPKREGYPFPNLCGAAMAFKLVQATLRAGRERKMDAFLAVQEGWEKWLLDLVAIATIADMVPLVGENRVLTHWGLQVLRKSPRPGIIALCIKLRLRKAELSEEDIGFSIGPRINAASRMGEPILALRLLTTKDHGEADAIATELEKLNASRKGVVAGIVREIKKRSKERFTEADKVVVLGDPEWKPALLGLAANSIMNDRGGVVCLWGRDGAGNIKGSCRSDGAISVVDLFTAATESFEEFGGHSASGGFSVIPDKVHTLQEDLASAAQTLSRIEKKPTPESDMTLTLKQVSWPLFRDMARLAPFGMGNPKPVIRISQAKVIGLKRFGKEQNHVEVTLECTETGETARAYDFFRAPEDFTQVPTQNEPTTAIATMERDTFRGGLALRLLDMLP